MELNFVVHQEYMALIVPRTVLLSASYMASHLVFWAIMLRTDRGRLYMLADCHIA